MAEEQHQRQSAPVSRQSRDLLEAMSNVPESQRTWKRLLPKPVEQDIGDGNDTADSIKPAQQEGEEKEVVDLRKLNRQQRQIIVDNALATNEQSNEVLLEKYAERADKAGVLLPTIEVCFRNVNMSAKVAVGSRALPTLPNSVINFIEDGLTAGKLMRSSKQKFDILKDLSGTISPGRLTLIMGPPGGGKSSLLQLLAGLTDPSAVQVSGEVTYNGDSLDRFLPERTAAYVPQDDQHIAKLTVQETLDFSARCQGTDMYKKVLKAVRQSEKKNGIKPDCDLDAFMKAQATEGRNGHVNSELMLRLLGLQECKDTLVGDSIIRGVSGGQRKRVTTGEMLVGPRLVWMMDEISTGLDSSTTFQIIQSLRHFAHLQRATICIALLQPAPEVFDLFDDVIVLAEGRMVYHGPRDQVVPFFDSLGFCLPERKGVADFLQEICSQKDQEQYWAGDPDAYAFIGVSQLAQAFKDSGISSVHCEEDQWEDTEAVRGGKKSARQAAQEKPRSKSKNNAEGAGHGDGDGAGEEEELDPLIHDKYALGSWKVFKACMRRDAIIMQRNSLVFLFRLGQLVVLSIVAATLLIRPIMYQNSIPDGQLYIALPFAMMVGLMMDNFSEMSITLESMHVMFRQRANRFYPGWAFAMPTTLLRIPYSFTMATLLSAIIYWVIGYDPNPGRFFSFLFLFMLAHQYALSLFRLIAALTRSIVMAYTVAWLIFLLHMLLGGFLLPKRFIHPWVVGGYWALPLQYIQNAIAINEFTGGRWNKPNPSANPPEQLGYAVLDFYDFRHQRYWVWVAFAVTIGWIVLLNILLLLAFSVLPAPRRGHATLPESAVKEAEQRDKGEADLASLGITPEHVRKSNSFKRRQPYPSELHGHQQPKSVPQTVNKAEGIPNGTADRDLESAKFQEPNGSQAWESNPVDAFKRSTVQHAQQGAESEPGTILQSPGHPSQPQHQQPGDYTIPEGGQQGSVHSQHDHVRSQTGPGHPQHLQAQSQDGSGHPQHLQAPSQDTAECVQNQQSPSPGTAGHPQPDWAAGHPLPEGASRWSLSSRRSLEKQSSAGMSLPFEQLNFAFHHISYSVPATNPDDPRNEDGQLMLLQDVSGAFRPHKLTCLMGASGAGKTTLMDCLAGRKTSGKVRGHMTVNGHPKNQQTFSRVCGYVEQNDIHAPGTTVYEALEFSAQMRILDVDKHQLKDFVDQVTDLMELGPLKGALVGLPGQSGLSVEQRKRLTIGVELCANPSVIFMDEPTSGLDARAAAIVMRTVRNTVNTGRTVVCTIHQPSIDIFESFDELVLLKPGGRMIYCGPTGHDSQQLIGYFQALEGVPSIQEGVNPATWMLEVTRNAEERRLGLDFAHVYRDSELYRQEEELIHKLKQPPEGSQALQFKSRYSRSLLDQFRLLLQRNSREYWRNPDYNTTRVYFTILFGLVLGAVYWRIGKQRTTPQGIAALCGAQLIANIFLGTSNASTVQPIAGQQRTILYRERAAGYYATYPFALAQFLVEIPYVLVQSVLFAVITYFMTYFYIDAAKFFWYFLFVFLNLLFFTCWGLITVALTPNIQVSAVLSSGVYTFWLIFGGFIVPRPQIHGWWIWFYFLDPLAYVIWGLIGSQLSDVSDISLQAQTGQFLAVNEYMTETYKFRHAFIGASAGILVAFIIMFHFATAFALQKLNFLKR